MIKLIVSDVDGTLIDKKYQIPGLNMRALQDCKREGIRIVMATGKLFYSLIPIIKPLGLTMPQISAGVATLIGINLKVHRAIKLNPDLYSEIIDYIKSSGCSPQLTDTADIITENNNEAGVDKAIYNHILEGRP